MKPFRFALILAGLSFLVAPRALPAADAVELRWRFGKDQVLKYLLKHREVRTAAIGDQKRVVTTDTEYDWQWTVKEIDEQGAATMEAKMTGLRVTSNGTDWEFQYDSTRGNESSDEYKKKLIHFYDQLRFTTYRLKLKPDGILAEVHGFDKLQGELAAALSTGAFSVLEFEGLNLRDDSYAWFLQQVLGVLPREAAVKGAEWNHSVRAQLAGLGELVGRNDFTLAGPVKVSERACQEVRLKGEQTLGVNLKWIGNNTLTGPLKTSKLAGTIRFDAAAGKLATAETQIELAGDLKLGSDDKSPLLKLSFQHTLELEAK